MKYLLRFVPEVIKLNPFHAEFKLFLDNWVNTIAADILDPGITGKLYISVFTTDAEICFILMYLLCSTWSSEIMDSLNIW